MPVKRKNEVEETLVDCSITFCNLLVSPYWRTKCWELKRNFGTLMIQVQHSTWKNTDGEFLYDYLLRASSFSKTFNTNRKQLRTPLSPTIRDKPIVSDRGQLPTSWSIYTAQFSCPVSIRVQQKIDGIWIVVFLPHTKVTQAEISITSIVINVLALKASKVLKYICDLILAAIPEVDQSLNRNPVFTNFILWIFCEI